MEKQLQTEEQHAHRLSGARRVTLEKSLVTGMGVPLVGGAHGQEPGPQRHGPRC